MPEDDDPKARPRGFEVREDIMQAQAAYIERGMSGPSPDRDMLLLPEEVRADLRSGFTRDRWAPSKEEAMTLSYEEMLARQRGEGDPS
jgi:hypothetical protein